LGYKVQTAVIFPLKHQYISV